MTRLAEACWLCFLNGVVTRLDAESRCPMHGLVLDRLLGFVQVDERILNRRPSERRA